MNLANPLIRPASAASTPERRCRLLRLKEVEILTGLKRSTIYALMRDGGGMPRPVRLTARAVGWNERDILDWCASRPGV